MAEALSSMRKPTPTARRSPSTVADSSPIFSRFAGGAPGPACRSMCSATPNSSTWPDGSTRREAYGTLVRGAPADIAARARESLADLDREREIYDACRRHAAPRRVGGGHRRDPLRKILAAEAKAEECRREACRQAEEAARPPTSRN
jgi:hypothetical protein